MKILAVWAIMLVWSSMGCASSRIITGQGNSVDLNAMLSNIKPGSILVIGENHGLQGHHDQQMAVLRKLSELELAPSVGMEFFEYPQQVNLDLYLAGKMTEVDFLQKVRWGKISFNFYRDQVLFPLNSGRSTTIALNSPRWLSAKISKGGLASLGPDDLAFMPPEFTLGRETYKDRFFESMPHLPNGNRENYFAAQSLWDDTMAWKASEFIKTNPQKVLVIIVGEFHVQFGGGLPDRLRARGIQQVQTLSLINTSDMSEDEVRQNIEVHPKWGPRADYLWLENAKESTSP